MNLKIVKLFGLGLALVVLGLGILSGLGGALGVAQPPPGQGTVYVTKAVYAPDGAILKPLDIGLGLFQTVVRDLGDPHNVLCGPDGRLYVNDLWRSERGREVHRILRFNQDGSGRTAVAEWDSDELRPGAMVFAPDGDLYFGTVSTDGGQLTKGIWRIPGALQADREFNPPKQILSPDIFTPPPSDKVGAAAEPYAFLTTGPFAGDLLIIDSPWVFSSDSEAEFVGDRVLRARSPDFTQVEEFIPRHKDPDTGEPFSAAGLAVTSEGDILITDFDNDKILRYGPDGTFKGIFAGMESPNEIAVGPDGLVYVTNVTFEERGPLRGGLFIFDPEGNPLVSANFNIFLKGVTVCAPQE